MYIRVYMYIYVYICSHKEHTSGSEVCVWLHMGIFICIFTYTHTRVYSIHVCVHVCAHTCTRGHSQAYARTSTCTLRTSRRGLLYWRPWSGSLAFLPRRLALPCLTRMDMRRKTRSRPPAKVPSSAQPSTPTVRLA
jgi:hypothetical protein